MRNNYIAGTALAAVVFLTSCITVYTPEVQQGNVVTQEMIDKLKPGMTRGQVRYVLGTPLIVDMFHQNRWDYFYYLKKDLKTPAETQSLALFFKNDALAVIQNNTRDKDKNTGATPPAEPVAPVPATKAL